MSSYSMKPEDLLGDELDHEMRIRHISVATTNREKTAHLRKALQKETDGFREAPVFCKLTFDDKKEFELCEDKMEELNKDLEVAFKNADHNSFTVSTSRVIHLFGRLNRLVVAFSKNLAYKEARESVRKTLENINKLRFPSKPVKQTVPVVMNNVTVNTPLGRGVQEGARSILAQVEDSLDNFEEGLGFRSSPTKLASNPEFRSLSDKVDKLTESFEKFLKSPIFSHSGVTESVATPTTSAPDKSRTVNIRNNSLERGNTDPNQGRCYQNDKKGSGFRAPRFDLGDQSNARDEVICNPLIRNPILDQRQRDRCYLDNNPIRHNPIEQRQRVDNDVRFLDNLHFENQRRSRRTIPVNQWNVKFSGEGGMSLSEFLGEVELFAQSEQFSDQELFASAIHLFSGHARKWFKANYDDFMSWEELVVALKEEFQSENYDFLLLSEIDSRLQGKDEPFSSFLAEMRILFGKLNASLSEKYKLFVLKKNMIPSHAMAISMLNITSVRELAIVCKRLDSAKFLQDKQNSASGIACFVEPAYRTPFTRRVYRNNVNEVEGSDVPFQEENEVSELRRNFNTRKPEYKNPGNDQRQSGETFEKLCYNCDGKDHFFRNCTAERKIFCYICGQKGATVNTCPRCRANHLNGNAGL